MNKEKLIIPDNIQEIITEIEKPRYWADYDLPDLPDYPYHSRKIVVSGFNFPDLESENDQRVYISIKQILTNKETGAIFKNVNVPIWTIFASDSIELKDEQTNHVYLVEKNIIDDEGNVLDTKQSSIQISSIGYDKYNTINKKIHFIDILNEYLRIFANEKKQDLENI